MTSPKFCSQANPQALIQVKVFASKPGLGCAAMKSKHHPKSEKGRHFQINGVSMCSSIDLHRWIIPEKDNYYRNVIVILEN